MRLSAITISPRAIPIVMAAFFIDGQFILAKSFISLATIFKAAAATMSPVALNNDVLGNNFKAIVISSKAAPIAVKPRLISSQFIPEKSSTTDANIFRPEATSINDNPVEMTCFAFPAKFANILISSKSAPIETKLRPMVSQLTFSNFFTTLDNMSNAEAINTIPAEELNDFFLKSVRLRNSESSKSNPPIAINPFIIPSQLIVDNTFTAAAIIRIDTAKDFIKKFTLRDPLKSLDIFPNAANATPSSINKAAIPNNALCSASESIVDKVKTEAVSIPIALAIFNRAPARNCS